MRQSVCIPLISVIVPIYKVELYLDRCIQSIVEQTYSNLEIILVDDGSPDHCPGICDAWAKRDERIHVIHKKNGGLSDARNVLINQMETGFSLSIVMITFFLPYVNGYLKQPKRLNLILRFALFSWTMAIEKRH